MVTKKATFKKVNYNEEIGASGSKKTAGSKEVAATSKRVSPQSNEQAEAHARKEVGALFAEKIAGKKMAVISEGAAKEIREKEGKKRSSEGTSSGQKKKVRVEELRGVEAEADSNKEDPEAYDLTFNYSGREHIGDNLRTSADLLSRIPCDVEYDFPEPESLVEKDAYKVYTRSMMEVNSLSTPTL